MITAKIKMPKLQTKKVWAGIYGGHYDQIVFFFKEPIKGTDSSNPNVYDTVDNKDYIAGDISLPQFKELFPDADIQQYYDRRGIDIEEIFEMELTAYWEKPFKKRPSGEFYQRLMDFNFHQDY